MKFQKWILSPQIQKNFLILDGPLGKARPSHTLRRYLQHLVITTGGLHRHLFPTLKVKTNLATETVYTSFSQW
jgi:hypothetical protein